MQAYLLLRNSDKTNYGSLATELSSQYHMKNNQYTINITNATCIMNIHCNDNYISQGKNIHNSQNKNQNTEKSQRIQMI